MKKLKKSDAISAGIGYTIGNVMIKGINFLAVPIFARIMTTSDYGLYNSYLAYESILFVIIGLALHSSIKSAKYKYREKLNEYCSSIILVAVISCLAFLVVGNIIFGSIEWFLGFSRLAFNLLLLQSFGIALITFFNEKISLEYKYKIFLLVAGINTIVNIGLSVFLIKVVFPDDSMIGRVIGGAVPAIILGLYVLWYLFKKARPRANKEYWKFGVKYSLPIVPHGISQVILSQFDRVMIQHMVSNSMAGIYSFAYNIGGVIQVIATSIMTAFSTWFFEKMDNKKYSEIRKNANFLVMAFSALCMGLCLIGPELVKTLGGEAYIDSIYCVVPIILATYFMFLYLLPAQIEYFYKKTRYIAIGTVSASIINIILNFIFINQYGYIAAAYTTLVSYFLYFVYHYVMARKIFKSQLYDTKYFVSHIILVMAVGAVAIACLENFTLRALLILGVMAYFAFGMVRVIGQKRSK